MQAGEALSSLAAQFGAEVGLPQPSWALAPQGMCCFASGTTARKTGSPVPLATPPLRDLVGTAQALPAFPAQLAIASLGFPAMPSQWPHAPSLLLQSVPCWLPGKGRDRLGWGHKAMGSMEPFVPSDGVCLGLKRQETKKSASQQAHPSDPDPASSRPWWSWALECGRQAPYFPVSFPLVLFQAGNSHREVKMSRRRVPKWQQLPVLGV